MFEPRFLFMVSLFMLLGFAAWRDIATRTVPDEVSIALALLGLGARCLDGWGAVALSATVAAGLFGLLLMCHARGLLGGADVKLLSALALGLSPLGSYQLLMITALAGGALAILSLL